MCGRYVLILPADALRALFDTVNLIDSVSRYNIAPTQPVIAVRNEEGGRMARLARWGLVPRWVKDPREFPLLVNARAETMAQKPAFRDSVDHGRCILPASGYYEWQVLPDGTRQPYYVTAADGGPVALAALWSSWTGPEGEEVDTVATITVPANDDLAAIHHRMPAIVDAPDIDAWLDVRGRRFAQIESLVAPRPAGALTAHPVSRTVNSAANDGPGLIIRAEPAAAGNTMKVKRKNKPQLDLFGG